MAILVVLFIAIVVFSILAVDYEKKKSKRIKKFNELSEKRKRDLSDLKEHNKVHAEQSAKTIRLREEAKFLEDEGNYDYAVMTYLREIELAKEYKFGFNRFSRSVHRVIILYGKMKRYEDLKSYLENLLKEYPEANETKDWKIRLNKVNIKIANQGNL